MVRKSVFDSLFREIRNICRRLDDIEKAFLRWNPTPPSVSDSKLLALPDHLRKTYVIVTSKGECDATQVSNLTGRSRSIESCYLNQLTRMNYLRKCRISKRIQYRLIADYSHKKTKNPFFEEASRNANPHSIITIEVEPNFPEELPEPS